MATEEKCSKAIDRERKITRGLFTKNANALDNLLDACEEGDIPLNITTQFFKVQELHNQLVELEREVRKGQRDIGEVNIEKEIENALEYKSRWLTLESKFNGKKIPREKGREKRNFKLPTLQFTMFDGDLKNWLPFWGQFKKIHEDVQIDSQDKYQYLLQAMKVGSEPRNLVEGFTPAAYEDCLSQLRARYAREELLIQVYVREMLGMINKSDISNIVNLYDKLSAQLRALEILGVAKDKFAAFLLPMVESALPQELLQIWERTKNRNSNLTNELADLLTFLRTEVESEQRIKLAKKTFEEVENTKTEPTAGCLLVNNNGPNKPKCVWCDKDTHNSLECYKLQKMSIEQRRAMLKEKKACGICLKKGHHPRYCKAFVKCTICGQRHAIVLCTGPKPEGSKGSAASSTNHSRFQTKALRVNTSEATREEDSSTTTTLSSTGKKAKSATTLLQTVSVIVSNGQKQVTVRAMFDSGAQRSYIREDIAHRLNITPTGNEILSHTLFGGVEITSKQYNVYDLNVTSLDKKFTIKLSALGQTCICRNIPTYTDTDLTQILTRHRITLSDNGQTSDDVGLLIGADFSGLVFTGDMIKLHDSLVAIKTKLGWTLQGRVANMLCTQVPTTQVAMFCSSDLSNFWSLETLGIRDPVETKTKAQNEQEVLNMFEDSVGINREGRYEVLLPWKVGHDELLNNYDLAFRRLQSITKKLKANGLYEDYNKVIDEWRELGIIEIVLDPQQEIKTSHYLPHRPVIKEKSTTTRIRPVFDASAKDRQGRSLNSCLDKGVNLLDKIPKLLNGFRKGAIGVTADIAKAFLQIAVSPQNRDMLRFLWWDERNSLVVYRHCRVVFGLTSSPFLLSATIQHHLRQVTGDLKKTADILFDSFYVENLLTSLDTVENVKQFELESREIMSQAKFDLRQWATGPTAVGDGDRVVSVLGLRWHIAEDTLSCNIEDLPPVCELGKITKRNLLSLTQRIYDPIGFVSAVTLVPRLILQEAWRRKLNWDTELPEDLKNKFIAWYGTEHNLNYCKIPRRLTIHNFNRCVLQLHMFCDASQNGYAACVYLRAENNNNISVRLVSAKSRVAPPEKLTIPRLELLAALIGSRLLVEARNDLKENCEEYCWTDSAVALYWVKKELPWNTYIGNRVKEIRLNTDMNIWSHIPGTSNWADLASRGCDAAHLLSSCWLEGPTWLYLKPEEWPKSTIVVDETEAHRELKKTAVCNTNLSTESMSNRLLYFSKYSKIIRTVAWMLRFVYNIRNKTKIQGELSYDEFEQAEKRVIKLIQTENKEYIEKKIQGLTYICHEDDGLIKIKTKLLLTTDIPECTKFPTVLPATSCITQRLALQRHQQLQHAGIATVMADLRARYWIIGARQLVKSVINNCGVCRRHRVKPLRAPAAPLPPERTQYSAPFEITGVDLAGPLYLRGGEKCWIVLYTCAVYRAVHLELTRSLSTEAFLMTLRRFIARRGRVNIIISDNGTNFVGSKNVLADLDWNEIQQLSTIHRIKWKLNAPTAAWWGGFWERLIKILKDLLKRVLGKSSVTYEELETILCDCEAVMNARPLTYVEDSTMHSLEPLTPSCFLQPISQTDVSDIDRVDSNSLNKRLRYLQKLREDFRERFKTEYLTTLVQRGKERRDDLRKGDVVLVESEEKRVKWPLGIVEEVFAGRDGIARTAKVRTSTGFKVRPFQRLYRLELADPETELPQPRIIPTVPAESLQRPATVDVGSVPGVSSTEPDPSKSTRSGRVTKLPSRYLI